MCIWLFAVHFSCTRLKQVENLEAGSSGEQGPPKSHCQGPRAAAASGSGTPVAGSSSGSLQQCQGAAIPPLQGAAPMMAPRPALYMQFASEDLVPATSHEGEAQQLLDAIFGPWPFLPEGCLPGALQQQLVVALFRQLLQPHSEVSLRQLVLPPASQPDTYYHPPFLHWLVVPHRARLWDLDADVGSVGCPPLDPELQILLVAAVRDHLVEQLGEERLGEEAFTRLLCNKDAHRANAVHRACAMSEPLFVRWLLDVLLPEDGASAAGSSAPRYFPPSPLFAKHDLLAYSLHGWLPLHDACKHGRVENAVSYIRALEVAFGGSRWGGCS